MSLKAQDVSVKIGSRFLFQNVSLNCPKGSSLAIIGESGAGKTTLLSVLSLMLPLHNGQILFDNVEAQRWSERSIRRFWRDNVSFVLQDAGLDDSGSVAYNISLKRQFLGRGKNKSEIAEASARVGLNDRLGSQVVELSGGEQRRVAIARAIYKRANYMFADEPTASLDDDNRQLVQKLLLEQAKQGAIVIIATHDLELASACDQIYRLQKA